MNDDIKLLLTESTKGLLSEETINKLVELNNKYVEEQLLEAAEKFVHKENEINEKFESLKADFVDWLDTLSEEIYDVKSKKDGISEINEDVSKFMKILSEMNKKYMDSETEVEEPEDEDSEKEDKKPKKMKKYAEQEKEDDDKEEKEPEEKDDMQESVIAELKLKNNNLIKAGLIAENITHNEKLSVKQKDDLCELCENQEFNGDVDVFLSFINQQVEIALKGNDTISNSGMSNDPTIIKEYNEKEEVIIDNVVDSKVKKLKKVYRPVMNRSYEADAKSAANKLV